MFYLVFAGGFLSFPANPSSHASALEKEVIPLQKEHLNLAVDLIESLLAKKDYTAVREQLVDMEAADVALLLSEFPEDRLPILFRLLPKELAAETFVEMDNDQQELLIHTFSDTELQEVLDEMYLDDTVDMIEEMPANLVHRILRHCDPESRKAINELMKYPDDSAGSIMTTEFVSLTADMTVEDAFKRIRRTGVDKETIYICYVVNDSRILIGLVSVRTLLLSDEDDIISDIMESSIVSINTLDDQETVSQMFNKYDFIAMPVVDQEHRLVGIITIDDAMDVMQAEATEDMEKMAAIMPSDKPYLKTGVFETFKARSPWLLMLMLSATFTGLILTHFENALMACAILTSFIPMLSGTGGNSGTQASTAVIRALSLGEIRFRDTFHVIWKEARVAILCGVCLACANFVKMMLIDRWMMHNPSVTVLVGVVVCATLVCTVLCAKIVGCSLPILAEKLGFDPAVMASPFITTVVDALSLLIYFRIATLLLGI